MSYHITRRNFIATGATAATLTATGTQASAQADWPSKPIKILVGYPAGGQTDLFARTYGEYISKQIGQPVLVENKAGASGSIAATELKRSAPDGHTLMFTISTTIIMNRALIKDIAYDTDRDFIIVSIMPAGSGALVLSEKSGVKNIKEFVEYARRTDKVSIGTYAAGSQAHMAIAELNREFGLKIEPVHYRGEAPMWADVAGQTLDGGFGSYGAALPVLQSGRGRIIAVTRKRMKVLPDIPTFLEQGVTSKLFQLTGFQSCSVPVGTPLQIVKRLSELLVEAGKSQKVQEMMATYSLDEPALNFEDTQKLYKDEAPIWLDLIKTLGMEPT